eukprot:scaffold31122_cov68-Cyclotella_meneghiniana.AAC.1
MQTNDSQPQLMRAGARHLSPRSVIYIYYTVGVAVNSLLFITHNVCHPHSIFPDNHDELSPFTHQTFQPANSCTAITPPGSQKKVQLSSTVGRDPSNLIFTGKLLQPAFHRSSYSPVGDRTSTSTTIHQPSIRLS